MSSWCVQGYPIGRVKRIKGGRTYDQPFLISTRAPPIPTVTTVVRVCVEDTTGFYVSLRSTTLSSRLHPSIRECTHGIEQRVSSSFSRSRIKRFFSKRITNIETVRFGKTRFKSGGFVHPFCLLSKRTRNRFVFVRLYILRSLSNAIAWITKRRRFRGG